MKYQKKKKKDKKKKRETEIGAESAENLFDLGLFLWKSIFTAHKGYLPTGHEKQ